MALSTAVMVGEAKEWVHDIKAKAEKLVVTAGHEAHADLGNFFKSLDFWHFDATKNKIDSCLAD